MEAFSGREREGHVLLCMRGLDWTLLIIGQQLLERWWEIGPYVNSAAPPPHPLRLPPGPAACSPVSLGEGRREEARPLQTAVVEAACILVPLPCLVQLSNAAPPAQQCCTLCRTILILFRLPEACGFGWLLKRNQGSLCRARVRKQLCGASRGHWNEAASSAHDSLSLQHRWLCAVSWDHHGEMWHKFPTHSCWQGAAVRLPAFSVAMKSGQDTRISSCHGDHGKLSRTAWAPG